jgi:hypothetical protein
VIAVTGRQRACRGAVRNVRRLVDHLEDPLAGGRRALRLPDPHAERAQRHDEHGEVEVERDEAAGRERSVCDHAGTREEHCGLREQRDERDERHVRRTLAVRPQRLLEDVLRAACELLLLGRLLCERLHDVDADDVLLGHGRDVGELLLHVSQRRVRDVAVAVRERDEEGGDGQHDERQPPLEEEQHDADRDDGEHVLEEEDEPVAEEEPDALQVDGGPRHQLARLVAVVEAEREPHELRVDAAAHVHLDVERLASGDEPPAGHQAGSKRAEAEDRAHRDPQRVRVPVKERRVDDAAAGHPDEGDLRRLRADGEHDRDDEAGAVRPQESEQADERRAVRDGAHLGRVSRG